MRVVHKTAVPRDTELPPCDRWRDDQLMSGRSWRCPVVHREAEGSRWARYGDEAAAVRVDGCRGGPALSVGHELP